jgi:cytochrome oxidase Cu insertion factor (SCO1/SenC/PrrC family)
MSLRLPVTVAARLALPALLGILVVLVGGGAAQVQPQEQHETPQPLAIGSAAPAFSLPGIDGRTYTLDSFRSSPLLAVVFTAVHCPTAEVYEERLKSLVQDYRSKGWRLR